MLGRRKSRTRGTRVRFAMEGQRRVVTVEGRDLRRWSGSGCDVCCSRCRSAPAPSSCIAIGRVGGASTFSAEIPEPLRQVIRNIFGNLSALRMP